MVEKSDDEKHFSWCCLLLQLSLLFFLVTLIASLAFLCFLSSHGFSTSLLITMSILFVSTSVFFLRSFKKKTRRCFVERSQEEGYDDEYEDEDSLIEIALVSEEAETLEAMRNINRSRERLSRIGDDDDDQEDEIDDVNMEEDNLIEIDISIGSIKRRM
ncbi:PREDICTED: uncharacterized protein LOC104726114 [Camelina sativa]|uniref:Uncharacterized protein LOC104726114 n=1 Tax=Camelina sativa TaxID=90675 RepID=A0ABM0UM82_CAMSA|nr:PREDICTED: uncharacterized protein LOC104726114 [Camelina sativa]